jgi:outer membrane protein TolC
LIEHQGPVLTLEAALAAASRANLGVRATREQIAQAEGTLTKAWSALLPRAQAQAIYTILDVERSANLGAGEIIVQPQTNLSGTGRVSLPLFHYESFGNLSNARAGREAARLGLEEARRQVQLAVARAYYGILSAHRYRDLQVRARANAEEHLDNAQARLTAGVGLRLDVTRAAMEVEQASSAIIAAQALEEDAYEALGVLLAMEGAFRVEELAAPAAPAPSVDALVQRAVAARSDQRLARLQTEIADRNVGAAWGAFVPSLDLAFNLTYAEFVGQLGGGDHVNWNVVFVLDVPLYDGGLRYGTLEERRAALRAAELREQELAQSASVEVRKAHRAWRTSLAKVDTAGRQVALAEEALRLAEAGYEAGASTNLEVVDAQRAKRDAEANLLVASYDSQVALATLLLSAGLPVR